MEFKLELEKIREKLINASIIGAIIFVFPAVFASILRFMEIGWQNVYWVHIFSTLIIATLFFFRNRIKTKIKVHLFLVTFLLISFSGAFYFKLSGASFIIYLAIMVGVLIYGKRVGITYLIIFMLGFILIAYLHISGSTNIDINFNEIQNSTFSWISFTITYLFSITIIIYTTSLFYKLLFAYTENLFQTTKKLKRANSELIASKKVISESEGKYRALFMSAGDAAFVFKDNKIIDCNERAVKILKGNRGDIMGLMPWDLSPTFQPNGKNSKEFALANIRKIFSKEIQQFEWQHKTLKDELIDVEIYVNPVDVNKNIFISTWRDITVRKEAEKALKKSESTAKALLNAPTDVGLLLDKNSKILAVNTTAINYFNKTEAELVGKLVWNFLPPDLSNQRKLKVEGVFTSGIPARFEDQNNGTWFDNVLYPVYDDLNEVTMVAVIARNISEHKKAEIKLLESEKRNKLVIDNVPVVIWKTSADGKTVFISENVERVYGYSAHEIYANGKESWFDRIHKEDIHKVEENFKRLFNENKPFDIEYRIQRKDGAWIWLHDFANTVQEENGVLYAYGVFHDVTNKKNIQFELLESKKRYKDFFEVARDGAFVTSLNGALIDCNLGLVELFGYSNKEELMGTSVLDLYANPDKRSAISGQILQNGFIKHSPTTFRKKDGTLIYTLMTATLLKNKSGKVEGFYGTITNNTKERLTEIELEKSKKRIFEVMVKSEEKERERYAKELHDGLGPLLSATKIYAKSLQTSENKEEQLLSFNKLDETIDEAILSVQEISNNISPHVLRNFGLKVAIESFFKKIHLATNISFVIKSNLEERFDETIETILYRIAIELIHNTIKYAKASEIVISLMCFGSIIKFNYMDDGLGFDLKKVLEESKGMGLFNIKSRIKSLNGKVEMKSKIGEGLKVEIEIKI